MKTALNILLLLLLVSCANDPFNEGDFFFLINKGAKMPVEVRGKTSSGVMIIFIHGGPGGTALQKIGLRGFNMLEENYGMVFWDQRASGSSQGNSSDDLLTLTQFTEDLDKLVDLISFRYNKPKIFLMGHSWGGCLGTAYLTESSRQNKISGWIEVDGAHNNPLGDELSKQFVIDYARQQISANIENEFWNYALDWYAKNPEFTTDQLEHYAFVEKAHGYIHDPSLKRDDVTFPEYSFNYIFNSPADLTQALTNYNHLIKNFIISDINLTNEMKSINIPSLIIWGEYDGIIPYPMAQQAYDALGTPPNKKSIVTLPDSGHFGFYEEPDPFAKAVKAFIELYR
jgi:pimeloyl-ACP methyl ester carboxylesterase